ncbi:hypothetical protein D3C80_1466490 [compost metagenome]
MHRQVHRHPDLRQALQLPVPRLLAGAAQDEFADRRDQPGFLGQADEVPRRHQPALRMAPAHQRLGGVEAVVGQAQLGLVEHLQLLFVDRLA